MISLKDNQKQQVILISKQVGEKKDAFRLISEESVPDFLKEYVTIQGGVATILSLEGEEKIDISHKPVIAYESIDPDRVANAHKLKRDSNNKIWNLWWKPNADDTLIEIDGDFYEKGNMPFPAQLTTRDYPFFWNELAEDEKNRFTQRDDGWEFVDINIGQKLKATYLKGFWVRYSEGSINFLEMGTPAADSYNVVDEEGNIIKSLNEFFQEII